MKLKYLLPLLIFMLIPVAGTATNEKDLEVYCDDMFYNQAYDAWHSLPDNAYQLRYMLGDRDNRGKYKYKMLDFCERMGDCAEARYGEVLIAGTDKRTTRLNMVAFALEFNNREVFETLVLNMPELRYLIDSGLYDGEDKIWSNNKFLTPALNAIKNGQVGVLKYLIKEYNVNLFKWGGYMYRRVPDYPPQNGKSMAEKAVNKWANKTPDANRLKCAEAVLKVVDDWYAKNINNRQLKAEAEEYNMALYKVASQKEYMIENITPLQFTPVTPLDLFKLQGIEEGFAINIDKKIDAIIEKIMRDFDLSAFGNQA